MLEQQGIQELAPRSREEAAELLRRASEQRTPVKLSSRHLNALAEYEPADLVISVQSGVTLPQIAAATRPNNQFLALDPAVRDDASIGSIVARGAAGPLRYAHGTPRDQVLGLEVVAGDGRILEFGGRVVKNVAGYDLVRLIVGSRGTLGFITRVNLRLKPVPAVDLTANIDAGTREAAIEVATAIRNSHLDAVALEIASPPLYRGWTVLARLHGNREAVTDATERITAIAGNAAVEIEDATPWARLNAHEASSPVCVRLANLPSSLTDTMSTAEQMAREAEIANAAFAAHAGDGIVRVLGSAARKDRGDVIEAARERMSAQGGSLIVERLQPDLNVDAFGRPETLELMRQIKHVFDPAGILGAGRFAL